MGQWGADVDRGEGVAEDEHCDGEGLGDEEGDEVAVADDFADAFEFVGAVVLAGECDGGLADGVGADVGKTFDAGAGCVAINDVGAAWALGVVYANDAALDDHVGEGEENSLDSGG